MKKSVSNIALLVVLFLAVALNGTLAMAAEMKTGMAAKSFAKDEAADVKATRMGEVFLMSGKIQALDLQHDTAVIDCPVGGKIFTVGGPLAPKAVLKKGGKAAQLKDFRQGEAVSVKWKAVPEGHLILMLSAK